MNHMKFENPSNRNAGLNWKIIDYPSVFIKLSDELAKIRTLHSKHIYKKGTEKFRGQREHDISKLGIFAELIARHYFENTKYKLDYTVAPLIEENPIVTADIILNDYGKKSKIDVKGVKSKGKHLRINFAAHNNAQKIVTHYLFIQPISNTQAKCLWINYEDVTHWQIVDSTFTKCYEKEI